MADKTLETTCCVVGGGPAGVMLGYLLARAGVEVTVLEKHQDFNRDFRGDTVHPSTLEVMYELGLLEDFLKVPHQKLTSVGGVLRRLRLQGGRFQPSANALQVRRTDAAVGLPGLPVRQSQAVPQLPSSNAARRALT